MAEDHLKRSASYGGTRRQEPAFEEDPLVELARIVAEDGGFYRHGRTPELRPARNEPVRHVEPFPEDSLANQLEAELMQNFELAGTPRPGRPARDAELRRVGDTPQGQPSYAPLRPADGAEHPRHHHTPQFPELVIEDARPRAPLPASIEHGARSAGDFDSGGAGHPGLEAAAELAGSWREADGPVHRGLAERFEEDFNAYDFELAEAAEAGQAGEPGFGTAGEGFAEMAEPQYDDAYSEAPAAYEHADPDSDDFVAEEEEYASHRERRASARGRGRGVYKRGLLAAAGVLGVVVLGGAVTAMVGNSGPGSVSGPPPVISAESGPAKVAPAQTDQAQLEEAAGQAVYDRVAGRAPESEEKLIDRTEEPRHVSRIVLPQADATDANTSADAGGETASSGEGLLGQISSETPSMQTGPRIDPVGPRRVRTVTVRPDGTIKESAAPVRVAQAPVQASGQVETDFIANAPEPVAVRTVTVKADEPAAPEPRDPDMAKPSAPAALSGPADTAAIPAVADPAQSESETAAETAPPSETQLAMLPRARPDEVPASFLSQARSAAASRQSEPVDLLAASPAPSRAPAEPASRSSAAAAASPYAVQLSAQRSEEQARAAFAGLKSRFSSVLGSREAEIERADLGEKGIYYRVRVGTQSQAEAGQLCEQLKAAGGSCFVTR